MKAGHTCHDGKPQQDQYLRKEPQSFYMGFIISSQDDIYGKEENILIGTMYTWGMDIKNICALNLERLQPRGHNHFSWDLFLGNIHSIFLESEFFLW